MLLNIRNKKKKWVYLLDIVTMTSSWVHQQQKWKYLYTILQLLQSAWCKRKQKHRYTKFSILGDCFASAKKSNWHGLGYLICKFFLIDTKVSNHRTVIKCSTSSHYGEENQSITELHYIVRRYNICKFQPLLAWNYTERWDSWCSLGPRGVPGTLNSLVKDSIG